MLSVLFWRFTRQRRGAVLSLSLLLFPGVPASAKSTQCCANNWSRQEQSTMGWQRVYGRLARMLSCVIVKCAGSKRWENHKNELLGSEKWKENASLYPFSHEEGCAIKLLLSSHGVGIPFIGSFVSSFSFPVYFIAMIFELLFPVKTFQLLRGRKVLCKQSGVRDVNGLHLLIQGNPIICMCARVQGFQCCICLGS